LSRYSVKGTEALAGIMQMSEQEHQAALEKELELVEAINADPANR
jgi:hypothetical protein